MGLCLLATAAEAQRIKDIATVKGVRYVHLKGIGIVAGLNGTGDSDKNLELQDKFSRVLRFWGGGDSRVASRNLALVLVTATVPTYLKPGQSFACTVSSIGDAKDLTGGQLLECALRGPITPVGNGGSEEVFYQDFAIAQGEVLVRPDSRVKTTGAVNAILEQDFGIPFHTDFEYITLLLNQPDFNTASQVAQAINQSRLMGDLRVALAQAVDSGSVQVRIPPHYLRGERIVDFVSIVLGQVQLRVQDIDREAKVIVNRRTKTIVINGEVKVRPFSALVDGLFVRIPPAPAPGGAEDAEGVPRPAAAGPESFRLIDVISEFQRQNLSHADLTSILRGMEQAGVLEGRLVEE